MPPFAGLPTCPFLSPPSPPPPLSLSLSPKVLVTKQTIVCLHLKRSRPKATRSPPPPHIPPPPPPSFLPALHPSLLPEHFSNPSQFCYQTSPLTIFPLLPPPATPPCTLPPLPPTCYLPDYVLTCRSQLHALLLLKDNRKGPQGRWRLTLKSFETENNIDKNSIVNSLID